MGLTTLPRVLPDTDGWCKHVRLRRKAPGNTTGKQMTVTVKIRTDTGERSYTGHVVCRGPSTMEMLLTEPFSMAGRTVHFPLTEIVSEQRQTAPSPGQAVPA